MSATVRTNAYQTVNGGQPKDYLSFKLESQQLRELPLPKPLFEVFVFSTRMEGVHLRMGFVARGGIRWSDRREDFRTEILGPHESPAGEEHGHRTGRRQGGIRTPPSGRRRPRRAGGRGHRLLSNPHQRFIGHHRQHRRREDRAAARRGAPRRRRCLPGRCRGQGNRDLFGYRQRHLGAVRFLAGRCLRIRRFRGLRPQENGDHRARRLGMRSNGISARSASTFRSRIFRGRHRRHGRRRVRQRHCCNTPHIRLVAAFNHQHIFIDPAPDAAVSFKERERLFGLPRSSWEDYSKKAISKGGGVYPRSAKSLSLSKEAQALLELPAVATPNEVIKAILRSHVDLLWNGGIGTYVKAGQREPFRCRRPQQTTRCASTAVN